MLYNDVILKPSMFFYMVHDHVTVTNKNEKK